MIAGIFPGQGSQHSGMAKPLYENFTSCKRLFEEASDAISVDMRKLCFDAAESDLALTENTQPALVLASTCTWTALNEVRPLTLSAGAGHSLGEYSALVAAGAIGFAPTLKAVRARGQAMQSAVPVGKGAMLAVMGLADEDVDTLCKWAVKTSGLGPLEPANFNAPGQVVVSGSAAAADWLRENINLEAAGLTGRAKLIPLKVSAPFHCSMMEPAQKAMKPVLEAMTVSSASFPIYQNVTAMPTTSANPLRDGLVQQITASVRWNPSVQNMVRTGLTKFVEVGPGKVLSGLVKKIDSERTHTFNVATIEDIRRYEAEGF